MEYKKVGGRQIGANVIPGRALVDGYEQAWTLLGAAGEIRRLAGLKEQTEAACPRLVAWLTSHPVRALGLANDWAQLLATVAWIDQRQTPGMYLRQVDVPGVDTKFIERHKGVLSDLLDQQLDSGRIDLGGSVTSRPASGSAASRPTSGSGVPPTAAAPARAASAS